MYLPLQSSTNLAVIQGLEQNGVEMKASISATGYGQDLLDSPAAQTLEPEHGVRGYAPSSLKTKATKQFQADLEKYAASPGSPITATTPATSSATWPSPVCSRREDPTRRLHRRHAQARTYDQAGLACQPVSLTLADYGKSAESGCGWYRAGKDGKFVVMNKGKPFTGKLVGDPELIAANKRGKAADVTTTAPPAS